MVAEGTNQVPSRSEYTATLPPTGRKAAKPPTHGNNKYGHTKPVPLVYQAGWAGMRARSRSVQRRTDKSVNRGRSSSVSRAAKVAGSAIKSAFSNVKQMATRRDSNASTDNNTRGVFPSRGRSPCRRELTVQDSNHDESEFNTEANGSKRVDKLDELLEHDVMKLDNKNTVVHVACLIHYDPADIIKRLTSEPSIAFERNDANELPLHYAAMDKKGVDNEVLKCLLNTNPKGVKQPNIQNSLPIHLACMVGVPSMTALKTFLKLYPKSVLIQSEFPLLFQKDMMVLEDKNSNSKHYEVEEDDSSEDNVEYVSELTNPSDGLVSKLENMLPLQADLRVVHKKKRTEANTTEQNPMDEGPLVETGFSPLHLAILNNANPIAIQMIVTTDPSCIRLKTSMGRTAQHCADYIVKQHWLYGAEDEASIENTLKSIEILEEYDGQDRIY